MTPVLRGCGATETLPLVADNSALPSEADEACTP